MERSFLKCVDGFKVDVLVEYVRTLLAFFVVMFAVDVEVESSSIFLHFSMCSCAVVYKERLNSTTYFELIAVFVCVQPLIFRVGNQCCQQGGSKGPRRAHPCRKFLLLWMTVQWRKRLILNQAAS